jgi:hypothetical protein
MCAGSMLRCIILLSIVAYYGAASSLFIRVRTREHSLRPNFVPLHPYPTPCLTAEFDSPEHTTQAPFIHPTPGSTSPLRGREPGPSNSLCAVPYGHSKCRSECSDIRYTCAFLSPYHVERHLSLKQCRFL